MCYAQIQVLPAGSETSLFKQFFIDWRDKDETTGPTKAYVIGRIAKVEQVPFDASSLHSNTTMAAQHGMVDDGKGKVQVRLVNLVVFMVCYDLGRAEGRSCRQRECLLASRSGVSRTATGFQWILPSMVTSMVEIVTSSSTATDYRAPASSTLFTPGEEKADVGKTDHNLVKFYVHKMPPGSRLLRYSYQAGAEVHSG